MPVSQRTNMVKENATKAVYIIHGYIGTPNIFAYTKQIAVKIKTGARVCVCACLFACMCVSICCVQMLMLHVIDIYIQKFCKLTLILIDDM